MFFNIYASPILRATVFSKYINASERVKLPSAITFNQVISKLDTQCDRCDRHILYSTRIEGHVITFTMMIDNDSAHVSFEVDYSYQRKDLPRRVKFAIIKWLIAIWSIEKGNFSEYICAPSTDGDVSEDKSWRGDIYSKFGFEWVSAKIMSYKA